MIPHENRRELRGLRVFSAWVNHTDAKAINSLDTLVVENGRSVVRHHLIDFNAALGSAGIGLREEARWLRISRRIRPGDEGASVVWLLRSSVADDPLPVLSRASAASSPSDSSPRNGVLASRTLPTCDREPDDTFWAARKLMAMCDDLIRAAVKAGHYTDPHAEDFLVAVPDRTPRQDRSCLADVGEPGRRSGSVRRRHADASAISPSI